MDIQDEQLGLTPEAFEMFRARGMQKVRQRLAENAEREALLAEINMGIACLEAKVRRVGRSRNFGPRTMSRRRESHRGRPGHRRVVSSRAGPPDDDLPAAPEPPTDVSRKQRGLA